MLTELHGTNEVIFLYIFRKKETSKNNICTKYFRE